MKTLHCLLTQLSSSDTITWIRTGCHRPRERSLRFALGKKGQVSSSMPECKPSFEGPGGTHLGQEEIRVGSQHDQYSLPHRGQPGQPPRQSLWCMCPETQDRHVPTPSKGLPAGLGTGEWLLPFSTKETGKKEDGKTPDILPNPLSSQSNKPCLNRKQSQIYHANWPFCMN